MFQPPTLINQPPEWEKIQTQIVMNSFIKMSDVELQSYLSTEWLNHKDRWSEGSTPEELLNYTQPSVGDLECLIEYLIDDTIKDMDVYKNNYDEIFNDLINQALSIFNNK
jgi:hypothetical protein